MASARGRGMAARVPHHRLPALLTALAMLLVLPSVLEPAFAAARMQVLPARRRPALRAIRVSNVPKEDEREIVDGPDGPIIVANVGGKYFAVDATCPHLNLPMKRGKIEDGEDGPTITCSFHNTCFSMKTGECKRWVTGAMGFENDFVSGIMGSLGGERLPSLGG